MPTPSEIIWRGVEIDSDRLIPSQVREELERRGMVTAVLETSGETRIRAYGRLVAAALSADPSNSLPSDAGTRAEPRWQLWADLSKAAGVDLWQPFQISGKSQSRLAPSGAPVAKVTAVTVALDGRTPLDEIVTALRRYWPKLVSQELVRPTRRMQKRTLAQVRHVCLDSSLGESWEARWRSWQNRYRKRGWGFADRRGFITNFHRAEKALTGSPGGLAWFYDEAARLPEDELRKRVRKGDPSAITEARRREDIQVGWLKDFMATLTRQSRKEKARGQTRSP